MEVTQHTVVAQLTEVAQHTEAAQAQLNHTVPYIHDFFFATTNFFMTFIVK